MIGLSDRDRTLLRSFLAASQARTGLRWDGDAAQPRVCFIDVDGQEGAEFWQSLTESERSGATVVISSASPPVAVPWLPKPLRSSSVLSVLEKMILPVRAPAAPAATAPAPGRSAQPARNPDAPLRLLDVLDDTASAAGARIVQSEHWPDLVFANGNAFAMRTAPIEEYVGGLAASSEVVRVARYAGGPMDDEQRLEPETLRWLVLLYAPLAEVAWRMPRTGRARLTALPPFGHLPHTLAHVRMAAWLVQHPATPAELAEMTGNTPEAVQRFFGACHALGLLHDAPEERIAAAVATPINLVVPDAPAVLVAAAQPIDDAPAHTAQPPAEPEPEVGEPPLPAPASDAAPVIAGESLSVLERLRATREQNRARVAAAIRSVSGR